MADYKKIAEEALRKANANKGIIPTVSTTQKTLNEGALYPDGIKERIHPTLEDDLVNQKTSLGKHPIFPEGDETSFEQKIMGDRFKEVANRYKTSHEVDSIDEEEMKKALMPLVNKAMFLEKTHEKKLEALAVKMIREEFDIDEDVMEIVADLTPDIDIEGTRLNPTPIKNDMEFKNHEEMVRAKDEVYKRRFVNAMIQGAAKKTHHMFHMAQDELAEMEPKLLNLYSKIMSAADYMYYAVPDMENGEKGGVVRVEFPSKNNKKVKIHAQAKIFPVLIHELTKGVMEVLSASGLPKKKLGKFVIDKADYLKAEPWDMRIGPALWDKFIKLFDADDFKLKHHVWNELVALPVKDFNIKMKEIMAGTKEGKKIIKDIVDIVKNEMKGDDFNEALDEIDRVNQEDAEGYDWDQLMGGPSDESDEEGYDDIGKLLS